MNIPFGEWLPDLPDYKNPGCTVAKNVISAGIHYEPFLGAVTYSNALDARCQGAFSTKDKDGNTVNFAGNASKLYKMTNAVYADASLAGGYITSTEEMWSFTQFGDKVIATNFADYPQTITMPSGSNFANLTTDLKARYVANINSFLIFGNVNDTDGNTPHRVRWSALGDSTDFTVSPVTQSDFQDLDPSKGWVKQVVSGEYGVIFQERAISRMDYAGSPIVWAFREVETGRGTQAPGSVVKAGNIIYYLGTDLGFWAFDGNQSYSIGENKINKTFKGEFDAGYLARVTARVDFEKQLVYWAAATSGNTGGLSNKIYCYNFSPNAARRWSYAETNVDIELIYTSLAEGYTLDSLDNINTNIDLIQQSFDSRVWTGESYVFSGFNSSHQQVNFTGSALNATLETGEVQLYPSNRANITAVRPLTEGASTVTVQMGTRNNQNDSVTYGTAVSANNAGDCPVRSNSRYHRVRVNISGGFTDVQGVEIVNAAKTGGR